MNIIQHLWQLILCLVIVVGPLPGSWLFVGLNNSSLYRDSVTHRLLIVLTGWCVFQVGLGLILGAFHLLYLPVLVGVEIIFLLLGLSSLRSRSLSPFSDWISDLLKVTRSLQPLELLIIASLTFVSVILINKITTLPMTGYDSLWFQLPPIARWYQTGNFSFLDPLGHRILEHLDAHLYPYNWQILGLFFVMPFGEDFLVAFPGLIAWGILGLSVYRNSKTLGATRLYSLGALSLILTIPMLQDQVNSFYLDLPLAAIFTFCLYALICYIKSRSTLDFFFLFINLGLLIGIKTVGLIYALLILALWSLSEIKYINSSYQKQTKLNYSSFINFGKIGGILGAIFLGFFWYIRLLYEKQPVSIADIESWQLASAVVSDTPFLQKLHGLQKSTLYYSFNLTNSTHWKILLSAIIVRLQIPFFIMLSQVLLSPLIFFSMSLNQEKKKNMLFLLIMVLITAFLYGNTPYSSGGNDISPLLGNNMRYGFIFICMLSIATAVSATLLKTYKYFLVSLILISNLMSIISQELFNAWRAASFQGESIIWGGVMMNMLWTKPQEFIKSVYNLMPHIMVNLFCYILLYLGLIIILSFLLLNRWNYSKIWHYLIRYWQKIKPILAISICLIILISASFLAREERDLKRRDIYQGIYEYMEFNLKENAKIAYSSSVRSYLLYGKHFNQEVLHIPLVSNNKIEQWVKEVRKSGVKFVAIGPTLNEQYSPAFSQLTSKNGILKPVFGKNNDFVNHPIIYELKRE
jgi:hypothetical protein